MCGFGGKISSQQVSREALNDAAQAVAFRGPDFTGVLTTDCCLEAQATKKHFGCFHNRLAIIDLDPRSNQPFSDDEHILLFNGEIYNFKELRKILEAQGVKFITQSDTEVLFHALKVWEERAIELLNGIFSFAFLNKQNGRLLLARDRVGTKPLYFTLTNDDIIFASEADTIARLCDRDPSIDEASMAVYRQLAFVGGRKSIYQGVSRVLPATFVILDALSAEILEERRYTETLPEMNGESAKGSREILSILEASVSDQLVADVPVGVFVSSGVDSSTLAALVIRNTPKQDVKFFTVKFVDDNEHDESQHARNFLQSLGVTAEDIIDVVISSADIKDAWLHVYRFIDEPFGDYALLLNYVISKAARRSVTVVISGDGGDEMFGGYDRYKVWPTIEKRRYRGFGGQCIHYMASRFGLRNLAIATEKNRFLKYLRSVSPRPDTARVWRGINKSLDLSSSLENYDHSDEFPMLVDRALYLPDGMLFKVDRASMAVGLEVRVPFLDNRVVELTRTTKMLSSKKPLKWRLKNVLTLLAPFYDVTRPKKGFSLPLAEWMRSDWADDIQRLVDSRSADALGLNKREMKNWIKKLNDGEDYYAYRLWIDCNLILWHETKMG